MFDSGTITRGGGGQVFDPASGQYVQTAGQQVYAGKCRVKPRDNADRVVDAGGEAVTLVPFVVSVPISDVVYQVDDLVTVTVASLDPALAGTVLRVRQVIVGTHLTARRLGCEVDQG